MFAFMAGVVVTVLVSVFFPVNYAKFVAFVRGFWDKAKAEENNTEV